MALLETPICDFGWKAPDFSLKTPGGQSVAFSDIRGGKGTLIAFICNHCPYVKAIIDRLVSDATALQNAGIGVAAVMPNDYESYPADHPDAMAAFAEAHDFPFPYLIDEDQSVAKTYGAVCTPDFFGFDGRDGLQYRGRIDDSPMRPDAVTRRELLDAMLQVVDTGVGPAEQIPSMGCSIKWRP